MLKACGFGPETGIPCTDTESAEGDRRATATEEHFVHSYQGEFTQQTHMNTQHRGKATFSKTHSFFLVCTRTLFPLNGEMGCVCHTNKPSLKAHYETKLILLL